MLDTEDFATWCNENCLCVVGHDGAVGGKEDHKPAEETDPKSKEKRAICPVYGGLTCEEHRQVKQDAGNAKEGYPKIEFPNGVPNTWMIGPDGVVVQMDQKDSMLPKNAIEAMTVFQKKYAGKPVGFKKWEAYRKLLDDGDKAVEAGKWKDAMTAYVKIDADVKKLSPGLIERVKTKAEELNGKLKARLEELTSAEADDATKLKNVRALRGEISAKFSFGPLAVLADIETWIKAQAPAPVAK